MTLSAEHSLNQTVHFPVGDAEQIGLLDQLTVLPDQLTVLSDELAQELVQGVHADLVEKSLGDQLVGLVPVISCILITLRQGDTKES